MTKEEMDQIDIYLIEKKLNFTEIAKKMGITRDLLYRYRKKTALYRSKTLKDINFRRKPPYYLSKNQT